MRWHSGDYLDPIYLAFVTLGQKLMYNLRAKGENSVS